MSVHMLVITLSGYAEVITEELLYNHVCVGVSASVTRCRLLGIGVFSYLDMIRGFSKIDEFFARLVT